MQYRRSKSQSMKVLSIFTEQIIGYNRKLAQELSTTSNLNMDSQELSLLKIPCEKTKNQKVCENALDILKRSRQLLGEEDTLQWTRKY